MKKLQMLEELTKSAKEFNLAIKLQKSEEFQKAGGLPVGSVRLWHGQKFIKQGDGHWVPLPSGQQGQSQQNQPQAQPQQQAQAPQPEQSQNQAEKVPKEQEAKPEKSIDSSPLGHLKPKEGFGGHVQLHSKDLDESLKNGKYSLISAGRNPNNPEDRALTDDQIKERYKRLETDLKDKGYKYSKVKGHYGGEEDSFMVHHAEPEHMNELGMKYNQDSVIHSEQGKHKMHFTTGENAGQHHKGEGHQEVPDAKDYYSVINTSDGQQKKFSLNFDFGKHHKADE
jgi:hypothetical protein